VKGRAAIQEIKDLLPDAEVHLLKMDLMNLQSVVSVVKEFCRSVENGLWILGHLPNTF
jgi:hypothetical protein